MTRKDKTSETRSGRKRTILMILGPVVVLVVGGYYWLTTGRYVETDDAYLHADHVSVSAQVSGQISELGVSSNDHVHKGQVLFRIDDQPYRIALRAAEAKLASVTNQIKSLKAGYQEARAELAGAEEDVAWLTRETRRKKDLVKKDVVSTARYDEMHHQLLKAKAHVQGLKERIRQIEAQLGGQPDLPLEEQADYKQALAARDKAQLDISHTVVRAPADGVVAKVDIQPGNVVQAGEPLFPLVRTDSLYVEANLKETELTHIRVGQQATVEVDAFPGHRWKAKVVSISPGSGSVFSLLPAENASGNWVKVVQRIPVRLELEPGANGPALRAGMSTQVTIDTGSGHTLLSKAEGDARQ
ncbi:MAG: HlyD family secretion protein [Gammaproteobacteria bacterium]|jgi:membrane fusion protein (multidrug efflux system)